MHERQRYEFGESAGAVLDLAQHVQMTDPVPWVSTWPYIIRTQTADPPRALC